MNCLSSKLHKIVMRWRSNFSPFIRNSEKEKGSILIYSEIECTGCFFFFDFFPILGNVEAIWLICLKFETMSWFYAKILVLKPSSLLKIRLKRYFSIKITRQKLSRFVIFDQKWQKHTITFSKKIPFHVKMRRIQFS